MPGSTSNPRPASPAMWPPVSVHPEAGDIHIPDSPDVLHPPNASIQMRWPAPATTAAPPMPSPATITPDEGGRIKSARSLYDALTNPSAGALRQATTNRRDTLAYPSNQTFRPDPTASARSRHDRSAYPGYTGYGQNAYPAPDTSMPGYYPTPGYPIRNYPGQYPPASGYTAGDSPFAGYAYPAGGEYAAPSWGNRYNGPPAPTGSQPLSSGDNIQ